ncbi:AAA family ATPase [Kangiella sediminilitoris]|uniref:ATPase AAA n=1 Tax=Kangiella sediminilitoris TaxID=1144748 RepID=A0A1B3B972_9GAMM|nr:MoxR family ATPase [Kangiella sediminilitoris]AOE49325.1 ATPase AAA [Kangiella sediminilitoris]
MNSSILPVLEQLNKVVLGKPLQVKLAVVCLLARGHLLIEDLPGMGKTTLGQAMAKVFGLDFQRIQFTSDILPADIVGANIFDREKSAFEFHQGPVFSQLVLADEINRATPKAQSALLEAMEEKQVTVEGHTYQLPSPFFVIATQNPTHQIGTYPLPESQLDRFLFKINLGYPDPELEKVLLKGQSGRTKMPQLESLIDLDSLLALQVEVEKITVTDHLLQYVMELIQATRRSPDFAHGLSPRAGLAIISAAKAWAFVDGRDFVLPDDIQQVFVAASRHRLQLVKTSSSSTLTLIEELMKDITVPA